MNDYTAPPPKRLIRNRDEAMIGGVCAGLADYFNLDVTLVRVLVVVGTVLGAGSLLLAYLAGWVLIPKS